MRVLIVVIFTILLCACTQRDERRDQANMSLSVFDLFPESLNDQNQILRNSLDIEQQEIFLIFDSLDSALAEMQEHLIAISGLLVSSPGGQFGLFANPRETKFVNQYFYSKNEYNDYAAKKFFEYLDSFYIELATRFDNSELKEIIGQRTEILIKEGMINERIEIFKNLNTEESIQIIKNFRLIIANHQLNLIIKLKNNQQMLSNIN